MLSMQRSTDAAYRRLTFVSAWTSFSFSVAVLLLVQNLPPSSSQVSRHVSYYAGFSALVSVAGVIGARRRHATLTTIFANYLLLDAIVFTVPRLLLLALAATTPFTLCAGAPDGSPSSPTSSATTDATSTPDASVRTSAAYNPRQIAYPDSLAGLERAASAALAALGGRRPCLAVSWACVTAVCLAGFAMIAGQWIAAVRVRGYARRLAREGDERQALLVLLREPAVSAAARGRGWSSTAWEEKMALQWQYQQQQQHEGQQQQRGGGEWGHKKACSCGSSAAVSPV